MQVLSIMEFKEWCDTTKPSSYHFSTENQEGEYQRKTLGVSQGFSNIIFIVNPDTICLLNDMGTCRFDMVERIERNDDVHNQVGWVFNIICKKFYNSDEEISYTIVADK